MSEVDPQSGVRSLTNAELRQRLGLPPKNLIEIISEYEAAHERLQERRRRGEMPNSSLKPFRVDVDSPPIDCEGSD